LAIKKPGWVKKSENAVTGAVTTVANNVSNSQTDKVARAVGYADFAAAKARGYGDSEILEVAHLESNSLCITTHPYLSRPAIGRWLAGR
jgi:hypothetical protein